MQHAPVTAAHVVAAHTVPLPWNTPPCAVHWACVRLWQVITPAAGMRHAPVWVVGQWALLQVVPFPWYVPPAAVHWASVVTIHGSAPGPAGRQHAPVGVVGHVVPLHTVPLPWYVPPPAR